MDDTKDNKIDVHCTTPKIKTSVIKIFYTLEPSTKNSMKNLT